MKHIKRILIVVLVTTCLSVQAKVTLPAIFSNHMVLQQKQDVRFWGWGKPCAWVKVIPSWTNDTIATRVNSNGDWEVKMTTPEALGNQSISIIEDGNEPVIINDILIGDVWLITGQSNMEWETSYGIVDGEQAKEGAKNDSIRFFKVAWRSSEYRQQDLEGEWVKCTPETMWEFSSIGYFFGNKVNKVSGVPIGLISDNWGGTPIEVWIPKERVVNDIFLYNASNKLPFFEWAPRTPGCLYNTMISPISSLKVKGVLWYQGESNVDNAYAYYKMLELLAKSWREDFGNFDFYYAQIAPFKNYLKNSGVEVRDAQRLALSKIKKSTMIVMSDIGDTTDIHPRTKIAQGERFADAVLNKTYGKAEFPALSPLFSGYELKGKCVIVNFDNSEGLHCNGNGLQLFEVQDGEGNWHSVSASIKDNAVELNCENVSEVKNVRFAWSNVATPLLFNADGLPASCFNTYDWQRDAYEILPWE